MQVSKLEDHTRKAMITINVKLLKLKPPMFSLYVAEGRSGRHRESQREREEESVGEQNNGAS
uniref:Uncharacterized protein n=1 Tax=Rhizophora mucronata TaxID=61149 RepID=A0A2P2QCP9_RHIMU